MATDFTLIVENRPGALADVAEALGRVGQNIEGICCFVSQGIAIVHVAVEEAGVARKELENIGLKVYEATEVVVVQIDDSPGAAGAVLRRLGNAGISIDMAYLATRTRLVVSARELDKIGAIIG